MNQVKHVAYCIVVKSYESNQTHTIYSLKIIFFFLHKLSNCFAQWWNLLVYSTHANLMFTNSHVKMV